MPIGDGDSLGVDSGFIVHNERTYPNLLRLFAELDVATRPTEMSMSITCEGCGLSYAGGKGGRGILAQPHRLAQPRFVRMLARGPALSPAGPRPAPHDGDDPTWGEFLRRGRSPVLLAHFAVPLVACVWSVRGRRRAALPGAAPVRVPRPPRHADRHRLSAWRTVVGGSATYVDRIAARLPDVRAGSG